MVRVDNVGAIFLANNLTTGDRTKHIDVRHHFVREIVEEGVVKIVFIRTADNDADLWTKNVTGELFEKHSDKVVWDESSVLAAGGVLESDSQSNRKVGRRVCGWRLNRWNALERATTCNNIPNSQFIVKCKSRRAIQ